MYADAVLRRWRVPRRQQWRWAGLPGTGGGPTSHGLDPSAHPWCLDMRLHTSTVRRTRKKLLLRDGTVSGRSAAFPGSVRSIQSVTSSPCERDDEAKGVGCISRRRMLRMAAAAPVLVGMPAVVSSLTAPAAKAAGLAGAVVFLDPDTTGPTIRRSASRYPPAAAAPRSARPAARPRRQVSPSIRSPGTWCC